MCICVYVYMCISNTNSNHVNSNKIHSNNVNSNNNNNNDNNNNIVNNVFIYIYIYIYTCTHTPLQRLRARDFDRKRSLLDVHSVHTYYIHNNPVLIPCNLKFLNSFHLTSGVQGCGV